MRIFASFSAICLVLAVIATAEGYAQTQPSPKPFTKDDVVKLLTGNVPAKRVEVLVRERGIDFQITPETESELRKAGANDALIATLKELAAKAVTPPPASPPTLTINSGVGHAHVYVDDEVIGTTSSEGRLKISTLTPGQHRVRVSLDGYLEFEEVVGLSAGQNFDLRAGLRPNSAPAHAEASNTAQRFRVAEHREFGKHLGWLTISDPVQYQSDDGKTSWRVAMGNIIELIAPTGKYEFSIVIRNRSPECLFDPIDAAGLQVSHEPIVEAFRRAGYVRRIRRP